MSTHAAKSERLQLEVGYMHECHGEQVLRHEDSRLFVMDGMEPRGVVAISTAQKMHCWLSRSNAALSGCMPNVHTRVLRAMVTVVLKCKLTINSQAAMNGSASYEGKGPG